MKMRFPIWLGLLVLMASASGGAAEDAMTIQLSGSGIEAGQLTLEDLQKLPMIEQDVQFQTSKGEEKGRYKGTLLWPILEAKGIKSAGHNAELKRTFIVEGRDGYQIAFSVGEIAPDFGNLQMTIAVERDGAALVPGEGFRLVVPGDTRGARYVRDVVKIEVR